MSGLLFDALVRSYDDGVAFHVFLPRKQAMEHSTLEREDTLVRLGGNQKVWTAYHGSKVPHQESEYAKGSMGNLPCTDIIVLARRSGDEWYVGPTTDSRARTVELPLTMLGKGRFVAHVFRDAPDADVHPEKLVVETLSVTSRDVLRLPLVPCGGAAIRLLPER